MFKRNAGPAAAAADAAEAITEYVDPLVKDAKLRKRLVAAIAAAAAARELAQRQVGFTGLANRLATDRRLRAELKQMVTQLQAAQKRSKKARSHKVRNTLLFATGIGLTAAAVPSVRTRVLSLLGRKDEWAAPSSPPAIIEEEIEVDVPVSTAYNQWTQFEEFPRFMDGVEEVKQLDDTLLHWAVSVAGKRAEWDAKIIEQQPDRRIVWESTDGKATRGTVSFGETAPGRTRVHLAMSYKPEGVAEKVGSTAGLDRRRVRGDLERFRELIEGRQVESGAWRGEIRQGETTRT